MQRNWKSWEGNMNKKAKELKEKIIKADHLF
jgi:hypothetical protein